jgi:hypothetical protein
MSKAELEKDRLTSMQELLESKSRLTKPSKMGSRLLRLPRQVYETGSFTIEREMQKMVMIMRRDASVSAGNNKWDVGV